MVRLSELWIGLYKRTVTNKKLDKILPILCVTLRFVLALPEQEFDSLCLYTVDRRGQHCHQSNFLLFEYILD
jgi:hypothetical protein